MLKLSRANIQPQQTDASRVVSSMMPQQYNATPIKTAIEALDLPERVEANTLDTSNIRGFNSNTPPSMSSIMKGIIPWQKLPRPVRLADKPCITTCNAQQL